jgi:2-oxoglutarate ferredoxin oxidoreductase subunit alpha
VTTTSGPGIDLKSETMGLAISLELPLLIIDIQRGGPSTGLPTKTEQADLLHAMYGRHGEAPLPIVAAKTPAHCFEATLEAVRLAVKYRTPVILLSDGYLANGTEPWRLPDLAELPVIDPGFATAPNHAEPDGGEIFWPYIRDAETLARPWAPPGLAGLEHRIGGLEKSDGAGNVAYDGPNHERMTRLRAAKVAGIAADIPPTDVDDEEGAELLVVGWGSTYGAIAAGVRRVRARGYRVAHAHLVHLNPFPADLGEVLGRYRKVLVPEVNLGQLSRLLRAEYLVDAVSLTQVQGIPFRAAALEAAILQQIEGAPDAGVDGSADSPGGNGRVAHAPKEKVSD